MSLVIDLRSDTRSLKYRFMAKVCFWANNNPTVVKKQLLTLLMRVRESCP